MLKVPTQISSTSETLELTLEYDAVNYVGPAFNAPVRAYNGELPGPTIRVRAGQTIELRLVNQLKAPIGNEVNRRPPPFYNGYEGNGFLVPNVTNIRE